MNHVKEIGCYLLQSCSVRLFVRHAPKRDLIERQKWKSALRSFFGFRNVVSLVFKGVRFQTFFDWNIEKCWVFSKLCSLWSTERLLGSVTKQLLTKCEVLPLQTGKFLTKLWLSLNRKRHQSLMGRLNHICVLKQDYNRRGTPLHLGETVGETRRNRFQGSAI